jgi:pSer/pThr/pTyr-binding forkhead associated (FHA) protein
MLVDGRKVERGELRDGGTVKIGNTTLTVHVMSQDVAPAQPRQDRTQDRARGRQRNRSGEGRV